MSIIKEKLLHWIQLQQKVAREVKDWQYTSAPYIACQLDLWNLLTECITEGVFDE